MSLRFILTVFLVVLPAMPGLSQNLLPAGTARTYGPFDEPPRPVEILGISVEGVADPALQAFVKQNSGLAEGQMVTIPGGPEVADAIRDLYELRLFSDVKVVEERRVGDGVFLAIHVKEEPRLADYSFAGIKKKHREELKKQVPLLKGSPVRPADLERSKQVIKEYYEEQGFLLAEVDVQRQETADNGVELTFEVDRGPRVEVGEIVIEGNEEISEGKLQRKMKETKKDRWWRFWKKETFKPDAYEEDIDRIIQYYNERGYYDARVVRDTFYLENGEGEPEAVVKLTVHEGPRYHVRDIEWDGNTLYPDEVLTDALGFEQGDVFNSTQLEQNLFGNKRSSDVASLYLNRGYMRFNVQPEIRVVEGDSLDLYFDVQEGDVYEFGDITITGNTKTKDHVIRRELYTIPGQTFSRDAIQETIRRLAQLNYFDQESLAQGPNIAVDEEDKQVDLTYDFTEVGSDQLELSGTYGRFGLVLMLRFNFNNFSIQDALEKDAWRPLPSGDGQKLSLSLQTNGTFYQSYSLGFTEPWFQGRPTPVGFNLSHRRFSGRTVFGDRSEDSDSKFIQTGANVFYQRRLEWPDDHFSSSTGIGYQYFVNRDFAASLPEGESQEITLQQSFSRNSLDHPLFPRRGSSMNFSVEVAPPIGDFVQYHKWRFQTEWHVPLAQKLSFSVGTDFGYIGSLTGDEVLFQRFIVGGSPFDTQGFYDNFGKDIIYMRGYPARVLGPRLDDEAVGGRILNKYTSELRWLAVQSPQLQAAPYLFLDAANTWDNFGTYNPAQLFRSAGVGVRFFLPILGMLELTYGYNFDMFEPLPGREGRHDGSQRWLFQFTIGQGFGQ